MDIQIAPENRKRFAEQLGLSEQYLYQCLTGRREMSAAEAMRAEIETSGALTRQMLCQRTYSAIWPELATPNRTPTNHPGQRSTDRPQKAGA